MLLNTVVVATQLGLPSLIVAGQTPNENYFEIINNYPDDANPGWHEDVQGIAHDLNNWFITQTSTIWKIPVERNLASPAGPGVGLRFIVQVPELAAVGYNHIGDGECYTHLGQTFLVLPIDGGPSAIAIFRADSLTYVDHALLEGQSGAPWCALDSGGNIYSSGFDDVSALRKYTVDWDAVVNENILRLGAASPMPLRDEYGNGVVLQRLQGGVITPSDRLIYLVTGFYDELLATDGIHVFDLEAQHRVQRSTRGFGYFNYEFYPGGVLSPREEPEGLTIWDLDNGRAPGISGQLHVLLLDNDEPDDDDVYLKHYRHYSRNPIYVDREYNGAEYGSAGQPFNRVLEAYNVSFDGAEVRIQSGSYPEKPTFSRMLTIIAEGGTVTIGK